MISNSSRVFGLALVAGLAFGVAFGLVGGKYLCDVTCELAADER